MAKIIIIEDEKNIRSAFRDILEYEGYEVDDAENGQEGIEMLVTDYYDVALCGLMMPKMGGFDVLFHAAEAGVSTQIIIITAYGSVDNATTSTRLGAFDFMVKPPDLNRLLTSVRNAVKHYKLVEENRPFRKKTYRVDQIVGQSSSIQTVREYIKRINAVSVNVLITGPPGAGKGIVAYNIHFQVKYADRTLPTVNCADLSDELLEIELFGHERDAFEGATSRKIGKLEQADGGTLFLDEIDNMSLAIQEKLVQAIQQKTFTRIGGTKKIKFAVRFISTTNKDLRRAVAEGNFRNDLYTHLSIITITIPPLTDRREDIPLLIDKFLCDISVEYGTPIKEVEPAAVDYLLTFPWNKNVSELRSVIERLVIMCGQVITLDEAKLYA